MNQNESQNKQNTKPNQKKKRKVFILFVFCLGTLFLLSFSVTSFILINSYRLTFVEEDYTRLQQQFGLLKSELSRKENEIEELKLQLADIEGESSFTNQNLNFKNR